MFFELSPIGASGFGCPAVAVEFVGALVCGADFLGFGAHPVGEFCPFGAGEGGSRHELFGEGVAGGGADAHVSCCAEDIGWFDSGQLGCVRWCGVDDCVHGASFRWLDWLFVRLFLSCVWVCFRLNLPR